jgi:single-strand DNA-binding protein
MLRVSLVGNLGADPELRYSQKGAPIASFRVAVNQVRTGQDGERQESTEWFRIRAMGRLADFAQRLQKGSRVVVFGRLDISHYQSREGDTRVGFDVWADEVQSMSGRGTGDGELGEAEPVLAGVSSLGEQRASNGNANGNAGRGRRAAGEAAEPEDLEDLPF